MPRTRPFFAINERYPRITEGPVGTHEQKCFTVICTSNQEEVSFKAISYLKNGDSQKHHDFTQQLVTRQDVSDVLLER